MKRPNRQNYDIGTYGDIKYDKAIEKYCSYIENRLLETESELKKLRLDAVVGRSEQLVCDMCGSSKLEECTKDEYACEDCGNFPITN